MGWSQAWPEAWKAVTEQSLVVEVCHRVAEVDHAEETAAEHIEDIEAAVTTAAGVTGAVTHDAVQAGTPVGRTGEPAAVLEHSIGTAVVEFETG